MQKGRVRRRVLACARCRKRKLACDGKVPACTRCVDANAACVGFDSSTQREAPRSVAAFLEEHIKNLQEAPAPIVQNPAKPQTSAAFPSPAASHASDGLQSQTGPEKSTHTDRLVNQIMEDITPPFLGISQAKPILSCVVRGTQVPSRKGPVGGTDLDENHPRSIINPQPSSWVGLRGIDLKTANGLFHNFLDRVLTSYPIYHRDDITAAFNSVYYPATYPGQDSPRNRYITSLVMAISLSTAARTKQRVANSHAYSLVQHAMQYIPTVATNDLAGLQAVLLLTQYIFLNPTMADLWLLTGLISQAVIDLGLHQELPSTTAITPYDRDMRRRIFWIAWEFEVAVCAIYLRPITLPTTSYSVQFPSELDDLAITHSGINTSNPEIPISKFACKRIWQFRQIEASIIHTMHHPSSTPSPPLPSATPTLPSWIRHIESEIGTWRSRVYLDAANNKDPKFASRWKEMELYADIATPYIMVLLHRPSRRIPNPSTSNLLSAFVNAVQVADGYYHQFNADFGNIKYVFHPCHHSFNSALIFLLALQRCKAEISERWDLDVVLNWMGRFSRFFDTVVERWPAAQRCVEEFERLAGPVRKEYVDFVLNKDTQAASAANASTRLYLNGLTPPQPHTHTQTQIHQPQNSTQDVTLDDVVPASAATASLYDDISFPQPPTELDDAFAFFQTFNPATTSHPTNPFFFSPSSGLGFDQATGAVPGANGSFYDTAWYVPQTVGDWNTEFGFDFDFDVDREFAALSGNGGFGLDASGSVPVAGGGMEGFTGLESPDPSNRRAGAAPANGTNTTGMDTLGLAGGGGGA